MVFQKGGSEAAKRNGPNGWCFFFPGFKGWSFHRNIGGETLREMFIRPKWFQVRVGQSLCWCVSFGVRCRHLGFASTTARSGSLGWVVFVVRSARNARFIFQMKRGGQVWDEKKNNSLESSSVSYVCFEGILAEDFFAGCKFFGSHGLIRDVKIYVSWVGCNGYSTELLE